MAHLPLGQSNAVAHLAKLVLALSLASIASTGGAKTYSSDLGTLGPTYEIREPDLLEDITATLRKKEASGELARIQAEGRQRAIASIREPKPVQGLNRTMVARTRYWNPSISIEENIIDDKGRVVVPRGTVTNPLDHVQLKRSMLFFDARDPAQLAYAKQAIAKLGSGVTPILVGGAVYDLMDRWRVRLFFDQQGLLVKRFGIQQVPAWVYQEGKVMRIDEVIAPAAEKDGKS
ncbi:MAG: type-F conjugative transfer system protein TraW [Aquabacterium sp.]|uniref:type-F conjugative transfer system protein TraW n=1 Tax=Aquabacterium sp. TaxID=1872578 RepID=UPI001E0D8DED|nr:type-F conjugative transfer system protein TraW [Aquabacterium sp.]MBT9609395.1 type-F conjugative transfer system protein TraW [Aquabacterium sp.]|tara:strand:+ start:586 stop:1284 length:699 start_codon:yes stop_codon:yes gene_type:complete